ncbi:hypothetical protein V499_00805 [Pseudogymnoascus sp. VKM F-103]|nr:hypothetical protein V499_00805 [Pseudogymnoascus sp. VKM F-103]
MNQGNDIRQRKVKRWNAWVDQYNHAVGNLQASSADFNAATNNVITIEGRKPPHPDGLNFNRQICPDTGAMGYDWFKAKHVRN